MARRVAVRSKKIAAPTKFTVEKAPDFRSIRADSSVPIGDPMEVTIILTRSEPGVLVQTVGAVISEEMEGLQEVAITNSDVSPVRVQAGHVILAHDRAAELGGNLLRLVEALNPELFETTLARFGLAKVSTKDAR